MPSSVVAPRRAKGWAAPPSVLLLDLWSHGPWPPHPAAPCPLPLAKGSALQSRTDSWLALSAARPLPTLSQFEAALIDPCNTAGARGQMAFINKLQQLKEGTG